MESQREVERQYNQLMHDVANNDYYKPNPATVINNYVCSCGHITKTKSIDVGVIPMMFDCENCGNHHARSTFYKDWRPGQEATVEWYRPTLQECLKMRKNPGLLHHVLQGGLCHRKIKPSLMKDLFNQEISPPLKHKGRPKINPCIAVWGKGPEGKKCGSCTHHYFKVLANKFPKCGKRQDKGSASTDHSSRYPACGAYEEKTD